LSQEHQHSRKLKPAKTTRKEPHKQQQSKTVISQPQHHNTIKTDGSTQSKPNITPSKPNTDTTSYTKAEPEPKHKRK